MHNIKVKHNAKYKLSKKSGCKYTDNKNYTLGKSRVWNCTECKKKYAQRKGVLKKICITWKM